MENQPLPSYGTTNAQPYVQQNPPVVPPKTPFFNSKKIILLGGVLLILIIIILLVIIMSLSSSKPTTTVQVTPTPTTDYSSINPLLATVAGEKIYKTSVEKAALEQYAPPAVSDQVIKSYLEIVIERKILDVEAKKLNLPLQSAQESNNQYYSSLREKVLSTQIDSVEAFVIGYAIPPIEEGYTQTPEVVQMRAVAHEVGDKIVSRLQTAESPYQIAQSVYNEYAILQPVLGLNGYILKSSPKQEFLEVPRKYIFDSRNKGQQFYETLFSLKQNEIKKSVWSDGSGLAVMKVLTVNNGPQSTYKNWLDQKKKQYVQYNYSALSEL